MTETKIGARPAQAGIFTAGAVACVATLVLAASAVGLYFVWPYSPDRMDAAQILEYLGRDMLGGLVSLDILMLIIAPINMIVFIALFVALEKENRAMAVMALVAGSLAFACLVVCRPIAELVALSGKYALASGDPERAVLVAGAAGILAYFHGTAWSIQTALFPIAGLIYALLMRKSAAFSTADSIVGILVSATAFGFVLPRVGLFFLFINTIGTIPWYIMVARRLSALAKKVRA
jgi:hypothetical protein